MGIKSISYPLLGVSWIQYMGMNLILIFVNHLLTFSYCNFSIFCQRGCNKQLIPQNRIHIIDPNPLIIPDPAVTFWRISKVTWTKKRNRKYQIEIHKKKLMTNSNNISKKTRFVWCISVRKRNKWRNTWIMYYNGNIC